MHGGLAQQVVEQAFNALFNGSVWALIAVGYSMVYGVLKLINFAHGEVFMVGAFVGYLAVVELHWPWMAGLGLAMVACPLLALLIERAAYRPLRAAPRLAALITAIGVSLLLQNLAIRIFSAEPKGYPRLLSDSALRLVIIGTAIACTVALHEVVHRTQVGTAIRAVSHDREAAALMGINVNRIVAIAFVLGSAAAGVAGVLYGMYYNVEPLMGFRPGLYAFVAAVLGGIGSVRGAAVGGLALGILLVAASSIAIPLGGEAALELSKYKTTITFLVLTAALLFRPAGLLGRGQVQKL